MSMVFVHVSSMPVLDGMAFVHVPSLYHDQCLLLRGSSCGHVVCGTVCAAVYSVRVIVFYPVDSVILFCPCDCDLFCPIMLFCPILFCPSVVLSDSVLSVVFCAVRVLFCPCGCVRFCLILFCPCDCVRFCSVGFCSVRGVLFCPCEWLCSVLIVFCSVRVCSVCAVLFHPWCSRSVLSVAL